MLRSHTRRLKCKGAANIVKPLIPFRRPLHVAPNTKQTPLPEPFRKFLKDRAKFARRRSPEDGHSSSQLTQETIDKWELTVGIEIHAQLNTEHKLFSHAHTETEQRPNTLVAPFDLAYPGSQPIFQPEVLIPALRAATALGCKIHKRSRFDRKHYFYHDQPAGYQITQYYRPFASQGEIILHPRDGIAEDESIHIGIKQVQLEQDTAKTNQQPPQSILLDFNRVGHPLIEVISLPHIHHPKTAAAYVRKISQLLVSVNAVTTGLESGGLRADVNVSVRLKNSDPGAHSYAGVSGLGQRTEIKNLNSFKAVEEAIVAERNRQITILQDGGEIQGETRGWTLGSTETVRLRGKEGEVDYRYMPDPDINPLYIDHDLRSYIRDTLPSLPDQQLDELCDEFGISELDAQALTANPSRLDYFHEVVDALETANVVPRQTAANWVMHELSGLFSTCQQEFDASRIKASELAEIIQLSSNKKVSGKTAKQLLGMLFDGDPRSVTQIVSEDDLAIQDLSADDYQAIATKVLEEHADVAEKVKAGQKGKLQFLVGQMMRQSGGKLDPRRASHAIESLLDDSNHGDATEQ